MFKHLFQFDYKRSVKEAIGFYLVYFVLVVLGGSLTGAAMMLATGSQDRQLAVRGGALFATGATLVLSFIILSKKKFWKRLRYLLVGILAVVLADLGGILFGLIPLAVLTTRGKS